MTAPLRIAIAGLGTVGSGVVRILQQNEALITRRAGRKIEIIALCARDRHKERGVDISGYEWISSPDDLAGFDRTDVVVELIGGERGAAYDLVKRALSCGKDVVTANKALMAHHGLEMAQIAEENNCQLMYEAAVAGSIPAVKSLREGYAANKISAVYGILNGTCNYILSTMRTSGRSFDDVLQEAQARGFAEADPAFDIEGTDAAHKICLLSALAFGIKPDMDHLSVTGISHITDKDIYYAGELGYRIKLLALAYKTDQGIIQSVEPCLVPQDNPLSAVEGSYNAVYVEGDFVDTGLSVGRGAGAGPTASALVADLIDRARDVKMPVFGMSLSELDDAQWADSDALSGRYYMHLTVKDRPGVMAEVTAILRDHDVSLEAVLQRSHDPDKPVSIILLTHTARQQDIKKACVKMGAMENSLAPPCRMRVESF